MTIIIGLLALLVASTLVSCAWGLGFGKGYALGEKHGRETAAAERPLPLTADAVTHAVLGRREPVELSRTRNRMSVS